MMGGLDGIDNAANALISAGIAIVIIVIILSLGYQSYAQTANQITTTYGTSAGVTKNFTQNGGGAINTFGSNLGLAIFVIIMAVVIFAIVNALRSARGSSGGFMG